MKSIVDFGLGLRTDHYEDIVANPGKVSWFEALSENYMVPGGSPLYWLDRIRRDYPMALHGVSMSIGSVDPLDMHYLGELKALINRVQPMWVSDHLCFTGLSGLNMHDLLPLPYTEESLEHVARRVLRVQEFLGRRILVENPSSYLQHAESAIPEWEFIAELARRTGCGILLDVNNAYVSACNHRLDALRFIDSIPARHVAEIHLAGFTRSDGILIDTHSRPVAAQVWALFARALERFGPRPALVEWDADLPPLARLVAEAGHAQALMEESHVLAA
jgi:uncharacterized protein (UPF0276 family)